MVVGLISAGRPKSGRIWKKKQEYRSSAKLRRGILSHLCLTFEEKERIKNEKKYTKELENELKNQKKIKLQEEKLRREEKTKRKAENEFKSSVFQVVS